MEAVAHSPSFAKKVGISTEVGKDFASADKGKKFKDGGLYDNINAKRERTRMSGVVEHSKGDAPRAKASLKRWKCPGW